MAHRDLLNKRGKVILTSDFWHSKADGDRVGAMKIRASVIMHDWFPSEELSRDGRC